MAETSSFPRGGMAGGTTARELRGDKVASSSKPSADALFGASARTKRIEIVADKSLKKKKKAKTNNGAVVGGSIVRNSIAGLSGILNASAGGGDAKVGLGMTKLSANSKTLKVDAITFVKYTAGSVALGYVLQVNDNRAIISLPGGVVGTVELSEISDATFRIVESQMAEKKRKLTKLSIDIRTLLTPMQAVRCFIVGMQDRPGSQSSGKKNLALSLRSSYINKSIQLKHLMPDFPISGCIVSKEDHGYVVSAGIGGVNFFLPSKNIPAAIGEIVIGRSGTASFNLFDSGRNWLVQ